MKLVLDTNAYSLCEAGHEYALQALEENPSLFLPVVVYGEIYYGFKYGTRLSQNLRRLEDFISHFEVVIIDINKQVARHFGDIFASLRKKGRPLPTNDIWIAASCLSVEGTLLTADKHFLQIDSLQVNLIPV